MQRRHALFSLFKKEGKESFARNLETRGFQMWASGGTATYLSSKGIAVHDVAKLVGPAILGHRVVTLSREIHASLLARKIPEDLAELERLGLPWMDLVYVDLYPLVQEIARVGHTFESVIEKTDIGGPTMLRSATKGRRLVLSAPKHVVWVERYLDREDEWPPDLKEAFISRLGAEAEKLVSRYASASSKFLRSQSNHPRLIDIIA